jgi:hypothetical protein
MAGEKKKVKKQEERREGGSDEVEQKRGLRTPSQVTDRLLTTKLMMSSYEA